MAAVEANVIVTAITTLVSGCLGAFLTNMFSYRRSNKEKLWELRRIAYGSVISKLMEIESIISNADECMKENVMSYYDSSISAEHDRSISIHMSYIGKTASDNYLILSNNFLKEYSTFNRDLSKGSQDLIQPEEHKIFAAAVRSARPRLLKQARSEMLLQG